MATAVAQPVGAMRAAHEDGVMDTRTPSPVQRNGSTDSGVPAGDGAYQPDLSAEVAMLSTKLVNAINYQTNLDDSLQQTRHELEQARAEVAKARAEKKSYDDMIANGLLVRKYYLDQTINQMREELATAKAEREAAEKAKKATEGELETLTSALFEEANTMVAAARRDTEAVQTRNSQLRSQLGDTEMLMASQQEQLQDLKQTMERMERISHDSHAMSIPTTPIDRTTAAFDAMQLSPNGISHDVAPEHPLHFTQLITPVLRNDIPAYTDFQDLLQLARRAAPHSRNSSNNTNSFASSSTPNLHSSTSPHLPGAFSFTTSSANNSPQSATFGEKPMPTLKETKFYKRTFLEDLDPCLRLDTAPGLSFLSRRTVLSSLLAGSLVVEPFLQPSNRLYASSIYACALCGESRKSEAHVRRHRFRTSEDEGAQRYPLCEYCLNRVRAAGDFVGFLRMVRDGHWKCESEEESKGAWEESVRLRERMFWARAGGGVVPAVHRGREERGSSPSTNAGIKSARTSLESASPERLRKEAVIAAASAVVETDGDGLRSRGSTLSQRAGDLDGAGTASSSMSSLPASGGVGKAVFGASSGVLGTARPDASPHRSNGVPAVRAPGSSEEAEDEDEDEATTPAFEDAPDSQQNQAEASEQLQREAGNLDSQPEQQPVIHEPAPPSPPEEPGSKSHSSSSSQRSGDLASPPPNERRPSAVQARIQAVEAKALAANSNGGRGEGRLPGAFD